DPDDRAVADRVVVGAQARVPLRVVADVDEELRRPGGHLDQLEEAACARPLFVNGDMARPGAIGEPGRVRAALGDPRQQRPGRERPLDPTFVAEAVSGDSTHSASDLSVADL